MAGRNETPRPEPTICTRGRQRGGGESLVSVEALAAETTGGQGMIAQTMPIFEEYQFLPVEGLGRDAPRGAERMVGRQSRHQFVVIDMRPIEASPCRRATR